MKKLYRSFLCQKIKLKGNHFFINFCTVQQNDNLIQPEKYLVKTFNSATLFLQHQQCDYKEIIGDYKNLVESLCQDSPMNDIFVEQLKILINMLLSFDMKQNVDIELTTLDLIYKCEDQLNKRGKTLLNLQNIFRLFRGLNNTNQTIFFKKFQFSILKELSIININKMMDFTQNCLYDSNLLQYVTQNTPIVQKIVKIFEFYVSRKAVELNDFIRLAINLKKMFPDAKTFKFLIDQVEMKINLKKKFVEQEYDNKQDVLDSQSLINLIEFLQDSEEVGVNLWNQVSQKIEINLFNSFQDQQIKVQILNLLKSNVFNMDNDFLRKMQNSFQIQLKNLNLRQIMEICNFYEFKQEGLQYFIQNKQFLEQHLIENQSGFKQILQSAHNLKIVNNFIRFLSQIYEQTSQQFKEQFDLQSIYLELINLYKIQNISEIVFNLTKILKKNSLDQKLIFDLKITKNEYLLTFQENPMLQLNQILNLLKMIKNQEKNQFLIQFKALLQEYFFTHQMKNNQHDDIENEVSIMLVLNELELTRELDIFEINHDKLDKNCQINYTQWIKLNERIHSIKINQKISQFNLNQLIKFKNLNQINVENATKISQTFQWLKPYYENYLTQNTESKYLHNIRASLSIVEQTVFYRLINNYQEVKGVYYYYDYLNYHFLIQCNNLDSILNPFMQEETNNKIKWKKEQSSEDQYQFVNDIKENEINSILKIYIDMIQINIGTKMLFFSLEHMILNNYQNMNASQFAKFINIIGQINKGSDEIDDIIQKFLSNNKDLSTEQAIQISYYLSVKLNTNQNLWNQVLNQIKETEVYQLNVHTFLQYFWVLESLKLEQSYIKTEVSTKLYQQMKQMNQLSQKIVWNKFPQKINDFLEKKYNFEKEIFAAGLFLMNFRINQNIYIWVLDQSSFLGLSQHEKGQTILFRRLIKKSKIQVRIFNYNEWAKLKRRHEKIDYYKQKLKNIEQAEQFLKQKYHYNY